jgi:D-arabinose 1-dehydrogenase-like Zn-dependent alcohol dehydrogenase
MKSYDVVDWGKPLQARVRNTPAPKGTEVLLQLTHCGVCHTDVHVRDGYFDLGGGKKFSYAERGIPLPLTLGHEPVGKVVASGEDVRDDIVGKQFLINPWIGCGACPMCATDRDNLCQTLRPIGMGAPWGAFGSHLLIRHPKYLVDIQGLRPDQAAPLACSGLTTYSAIKKLQPVDPMEWVAILGCGGLGLMALAILRGLGHERIVACDIDDTKLAAAHTSGAAETCNLKTQGLKHLRRVAGGPVYGMLDFVGSPETVSLAAPALRKGGRFVVSGLMGGAASVSIPVLALNEIAIQGSAVGNTPDLVELVGLVKRGKIRLPEVERRPLSAAEQSLQDLVAGRIVGRVVLEIAEDA